MTMKITEVILLYYHTMLFILLYIIHFFSFTNVLYRASLHRVSLAFICFSQSFLTKNILVHIDFYLPLIRWYNMIVQTQIKSTKVPSSVHLYAYLLVNYYPRIILKFSASTQKWIKYHHTELCFIYERNGSTWPNSLVHNATSPSDS